MEVYSITFVLVGFMSSSQFAARTHIFPNVPTRISLKTQGNISNNNITQSLTYARTLTSLLSSIQGAHQGLQHEKGGLIGRAYFVDSWLRLPAFVPKTICAYLKECDSYLSKIQLLATLMADSYPADSPCILGASIDVCNRCSISLLSTS